MSARLYSAMASIGRAILDVMREANGEALAAREIAKRVMSKVDMPASAQMAITSRVNSGLTYLKAQKRVAKAGNKLAARWTLGTNGAWHEISRLTATAALRRKNATESGLKL
jgi:hypothetical protein